MCQRIHWATHSAICGQSKSHENENAANTHESTSTTSSPTSKASSSIESAPRPSLSHSEDSIIPKLSDGCPVVGGHPDVRVGAGLGRWRETANISPEATSDIHMRERCETVQRNSMKTPSGTNHEPCNGQSFITFQTPAVPSGVCRSVSRQSRRGSDFEKDPFSLLGSPCNPTVSSASYTSLSTSNGVSPSRTRAVESHTANQQEQHEQNGLRDMVFRQQSLPDGCRPGGLIVLNPESPERFSGAPTATRERQHYCSNGGGISSRSGRNAELNARNPSGGPDGHRASNFERPPDGVNELQCGIRSSERHMSFSSQQSAREGDVHLLHNRSGGTEQSAADMLMTVPPQMPQVPKAACVACALSQQPVPFAESFPFMNAASMPFPFGPFRSPFAGVTGQPPVASGAPVAKEMEQLCKQPAMPPQSPMQMPGLQHAFARGEQHLPRHLEAPGAPQPPAHQFFPPPPQRVSPHFSPSAHNLPMEISAASAQPPVPRVSPQTQRSAEQLVDPVHPMVDMGQVQHYMKAGLLPSAMEALSPVRSARDPLAAAMASAAHLPGPIPNAQLSPQSPKNMFLQQQLSERQQAMGRRHYAKEHHAEPTPEQEQQQLLNMRQQAEQYRRQQHQMQAAAQQFAQAAGMQQRFESPAMWPPFAYPAGFLRPPGFPFQQQH